VVDYPCGKFGDFSFSRLGFVMWTNRHTETYAAERFAPPELLRMSINVITIESGTEK